MKMILGKPYQPPAPHISTLTYSDIQIIEKGAATLFGDWYLDPVIDLKRSGRPRIWVRSKDAAAVPISAMAFERIGPRIWISLYFEKADECETAKGWPFESIAAAFIYLWAWLEAVAIIGANGPVPRQGQCEQDVLA